MSCFHKAQPLGHNSHGIDACVCLSVCMYVCPHPEDAWTFRNLLDSLNRQNYHIKNNKSSLRVKLNLLKCADSSLNTIRMSPVSPVTSHMSLRPTATAMTPPPAATDAYSPTIHSSTPP